MNYTEFRPAAESGPDPIEDPEPVEADLTCLTVEQQERQEALYAASAVLRNDAGGVFSKGAKPGASPDLIAVAQYIETGRATFLLPEGIHPAWSRTASGVGEVEP